MWSLDGLRLTVHVGDREVPPAEGERSVGEQAPHDRDRLAKAFDARPWRVELQPGRAIFRLVPTGTEADYETPLAEDVERRQVLCQDGGMTQVVIEHERAQAEAFRRRGDDAEQRDWSELSGKVIVNAEVAEPDRFGKPDPIDELSPIDDVAGSDHQPERLHRVVRVYPALRTADTIARRPGRCPYSRTPAA